MKHKGLLILAGLLLTACSLPERPPEPPPASEVAPAPAEQEQPTATPLAAVGTAELCRRYGQRADAADTSGEDGEDSAALRRELQQRGVFSTAEWRLVESRRVVRGMNECALAAAWSGDTARAVNVTFSNGDHGRRLFYDCRQTEAPYCPYTRVDIRAGRVDAVRQSHFLE